MAKTNKEKSVELAKSIVKNRHEYTCEICGRSRENNGVQIHGAHIKPVTYSATAAEPYNILSLCAGCHSVGAKSQHQDPVPFSRWLDDTYPGRYDHLHEKAISYSQNPFPKIDWQEKLDELKQIAKQEGAV